MQLLIPHLSPQPWLRLHFYLVFCRCIHVCRIRDWSLMHYCLNQWHYNKYVSCMSHLPPSLELHCPPVGTCSIGELYCECQGLSPLVYVLISQRPCDLHLRLCSVWHANIWRNSRGDCVLCVWRDREKEREDIKSSGQICFPLLWQIAPPTTF